MKKKTNEIGRGKSQMNADQNTTTVSVRVDLRSLAALLLLFGPVACGPRNFINENDRLRAENMALAKQIEDLTHRAEAAEKQLEIQKESHATQAPALPEGVHRPVTTRIEIVGPSRGVDTDENGMDDAVRIYLATYDHRGRFLPTVGTVKVTVAAITAGQPAVTVAAAEIDAQMFDDSYRSSFTGTHYTLMAPLSAAVPQGVDKLTVTVELTDLLTGEKHETQKIVNVDVTP